MFTAGPGNHLLELSHLASLPAASQRAHCAQPAMSKGNVWPASLVTCFDGSVINEDIKIKYALVSKISA
jgi:hypothetical protein